MKRNKLDKLLGKLKAFFSAEFRDQVAQKDELKKIIEKLKKRGKKVQLALEQETEPDNIKLYQEDLDIIKIQRVKAQKLLKSLIQQQ